MTEVRPMRELAPHLVWEAVLLLAAGAVVAGLYNANSAVFTRGQVWAGVAILGFAACGLALSLRTATPNLAIGSIGVLSGWVFADRVNDGASVTVGSVVAVLAAAGVGLLLALLTGLTSLPAWAVTLASAFVISAALLKATEGQLVPVPRAARAVEGFGLWAVAFAVVSIAGAVLFALPAVRRLLSANRPVDGDADPSRWRPAKFVGALVGIVGSSVLAGVAGVLTARYTSAAAYAESGQLPYAIAAVLLGGVSVFGRRAGVFGVVLAVVIVDGVRRWLALENVDAATTMLTVGVIGLVGLLAVWLLELVGRRVAPLSVAGPRPTPAFSGFPPPMYDGSFPPPGVAGAPVSGAPDFAPGGPPPGFAGPAPFGSPPGFAGPAPFGSPAGVAPQSGIPAQSSGQTPAQHSGYPAPPPPTSGGPVFGQPIYPSTPPVSGPPAFPPQYGGPPPAGGTIPQPWTVPAAGGPAPQVPTQPVSPPVSGPPNADPPPGYPQTPPPSWPPQS
ncbi:hypothetical protein [Dactylosporangium sp. NPDC005555]|uniref:hypothetical protein n=1 Tax=Dactylosporangium sp. NPDC005555 TaxID=3154889 RepID=UPI0033A14D72